MKFKREKLDTGIVQTEVFGAMDLKQSLASLDDLSTYVENNELYELVIHRDDASISVNFPDSKSIVDRAELLFNNLKQGAIAFVVTNDLDFGLCRQMQSLIGNERVPIKVFRNEAEATQWLVEYKNTPHLSDT